MEYSSWNVHDFPRDSAVTLYESGLNPLLAVVLASRGITDIAGAETQLDRSTEHLPDPFLLKDMDKAVKRIRLATEKHEKVMVFGDYDVDGMTSTVVMLEYLRSLGLETDYYIPGRDEGYGLSKDALSKFSADGYNLVVTVDCGVTQVDEVAHANKLGLDIVITDHHECKYELPDAVAVVNPKRHDNEYPNRNLAGVGVAFKTICALETHKPNNAHNLDYLLQQYAELVALGSIADVVPVSGENSALITRGMIELANTRRPGLRALMEDTGIINRRLTTVGIGFSIAPRLNAAGRMGCPRLSVHLLTSESRDEALILSKQLMQINDERRDLVSRIYDEAEAQANNQKGALVLYDKEWDQGVMGIIAARIAEQKQVPTLMITGNKQDGDAVLGRGSCRSFGDFPLYAALESCKDLLDNFGGHAMAAGITIKTENIDEFSRRIKDYYEDYKSLNPDSAKNVLEIDYDVVKPEKLLTLENLEALTELEPYGNGNPPPILCIKNAELTIASEVGSGAHTKTHTKTHTKIRVSKNGEQYDGIYFSHAPESLSVSKGDSVDIAFEPQINEFRGRRSVQLMVVDLKPHR